MYNLLKVHDSWCISGKFIANAFPEKLLSNTVKLSRSCFSGSCILYKFATYSTI